MPLLDVDNAEHVLQAVPGVRVRKERVIRPRGSEAEKRVHRFSVVIPDHNYAEFLPEAIDSALALERPDVEVVVVDDGSTDESVKVARRYGGRIKLIEQENRGPREACNAGFAVTTGDWVVFLDSDDVLRPEVARHVDSESAKNVSKVQVQMQRIDRHGRTVGNVFPRFRRLPTAEQLRRWIRETGAYPTPPGSGNVYARWFLERLFPLGPECDDATDSACLAAAPSSERCARSPFLGSRPRYDVHCSATSSPSASTDAGMLLARLAG